MASKFWLCAIVYEFIIVSIRWIQDGDSKIASIGMLLFYTLNFWGCRIVEQIKEQTDVESNSNRE